jgi:ribosomal protein S18 acetylase RimI-like enzyme
MLTIRAGRLADVDAFSRSTLGNAFESEGLRLDEATVRRGVTALLEDSRKGMPFVAELDGQVVGTLYVTFEWSDWHASWYWWLQSVFVDPAHRGKGVYSALYAAVREAAAKAGNVRAIRLYVERNNEKALRAYRGHGMKETEYLVFDALS